jgi:hypothetical protein
MITALVLAAGPLEALATTLSALIPAVADGLIGDAVVLAPAPDPQAERVAEAVGAAFVVAAGADPWPDGAAVARREWVLCLEAGDLPSEGWIRTLERFVALAPQDRRFGRLPRRHATLAARLRALARIGGSRRLRPGDLIHRSLLQGSAARTRPATLAAFVERDPAFG